MPFPRKRLMFEQTGVDQGLLDQMVELKKFLRGITDTSSSWLGASGAANTAFVPKISTLFNMTDTAKISISNNVTLNAKGNNYNIWKYGTNKMVYGGAQLCCVFKVNVPGWIYRNHWKGGWNPGPEVAVFVARSTKAPTTADQANALNWVCLFRSRGDGQFGESTEANNHANNFFPINPGSNTYLAIVTSGKYFNKTAAERQFLLYIPAFGYTGNPLTPAGNYKINSNTYKIVPPASSIDAIKDAFK